MSYRNTLLNNIKQNKINRLTIGQFSNALLTIDKAHITTQGPGLHTRLRWLKPVLWSQPYHSLCLKYLWQVSPQCRNKNQTK